MSRMAALGFVATFGAACGGNPPAAPPPCDQTCLDGTALRSLRETMRVAYNGTLMGGPVGAQDATFDCLMNGTAHVFGTASSQPEQGSTFVTLTYEFHACLHAAVPNPTADRNYVMLLDGTATEDGTIAVQPTATTSLQIQSQDMTFAGQVSDPPVDYAESNCAVDVLQDGGSVSGFLCGRMAGFGF
jgi:hypothetical protein